MTIGNRTMTSLHNRDSGATVTSVTLTWGDDKVQNFNGTGAKSLYLPLGDTKNAYGEIYIYNSQSSGSLTIEKDHAATEGIRNVIGNADKTVAAGKAAYCQYVPYRREYDESRNRPDGQKRGQWMVIVGA